MFSACAPMMTSGSAEGPAGRVVVGVVVAGGTAALAVLVVVVAAGLWSERRPPSACGSGRPRPADGKPWPGRKRRGHPVSTLVLVYRAPENHQAGGADAMAARSKLVLRKWAPALSNGATAFSIAPCSATASPTPSSVATRW